MECAFKSAIAKQIKEHDFPDRKLINDSYTHDLTRLLKLSGLDQTHDQEQKSDPDFAVNWTTVKDWSEDNRYSASISERKARDMFSAVTDSQHGVLPWLKRHW